ncbi:ABC transporter substrate-binding protein [Cohnella cellulosilytica]|uniref:ABC transporter substrate-binding protein n=1 Tax=Cohnella cellulosilytica TaxID=986710 RepID=A0ABW2FLN7_9BACL
MLFSGKRASVLGVVLASAMALSACGGAQGGNAAGRTYSDAKGDKQIPERPSRVVTTQYLPHMLALGEKPVGAPGFLIDALNRLNEVSGRSYDATGIEDVGYPPDEERMTAINPDLIVTLDDENYDNYSKIAPTAIVSFLELNVWDQLLRVGEALNREDEARAWIDEYNRKAKEAKDKLPSSSGESETVGVYRIYQKELRVYGARNGGYVLYDSLGLKPPAPITDLIGKDPNFVYESISLEKLPEFAADRMIVLVTDDQESKTFLEEVQNSALWQNLAAVREGRLHFVDNNVWLNYSPLAIDYQLEQAADLLTGS